MFSPSFPVVFIHCRDDYLHGHDEWLLSGESLSVLLWHRASRHHGIGSTTAIGKRKHPASTQRSNSRYGVGEYPITGYPEI